MRSKSKSYPRPPKAPKPSYLKHIFKTKHGTYSIDKSVNGKRVHFTTCKTLHEAIHIRNLLRDNNWEHLPLTGDEVYEKNWKDYYTGLTRTFNGRRYQVYNNNGEYLATIPTIEEALYYRDQYYTYNKNDAPRPSTIDLITNNWYINDGLEYPIPERLIQYKNTTYGEGVIKKKGENSYHVHYGGSNNGHKSYICACRTYEQAYYVKQEMNKCNWDKKQLQRILDDYPLWYTKLMELYRYVHLDHDYKRKTGEEKYKINIPRPYLEEGQNLVNITGYSHVEDALYERDFLINHDWDYELLVEAIDDTKNPYYDMDLPPYPQRKILNLKARDYHEKELTLVYELINDDPKLSQDDICEILGITAVTFRGWFSKFWNTNWREFRKISLSGENPINVLEKVPIVYQPDLSRPKPANFKGYIQYSSRDKRSPYKVVKDGIRYGSYFNKKQARKAVKLLEDYDWDKSKVSEIQEKVGWKPLPKRGNIYPNTGGYGWSIRHKDKSTRKFINYGCNYKNYNLAVMVRDMLIINDWNKDEYPSIRSLAEDVLYIQRLLYSNMFAGEYDYTISEKIFYLETIQKDPNKYIYPYHNQGYMIQKSIDGSVKRFGTYKTKEDALMVRNLLIDNDWDSDVLDLVEELGL